MKLSCRDRILDLGMPAVMGILNVTPDSFSDGGRYVTLDAAVERGLRMAEEGAAIVDVGGESTRPGAAAIGAQQEIDRVVPVIERIAARSHVLLSVDTSKPEVMAAAATAGAQLINDVRALQATGALEAAANERRGRVPDAHAGRARHDAGRIRSTWTSSARCKAFLAARVAACTDAGIAASTNLHRSGHRLRQTARTQPRAARGPAGAGASWLSGTDRRFPQVADRYDHGSTGGRSLAWQPRARRARGRTRGVDHPRARRGGDGRRGENCGGAGSAAGTDRSLTMARRFFGTDGVRGQVGQHPMTVEFALRLASAAARVLAPEGGTALVGKDTRLSGYMFEAALEAGFVAAGVERQPDRSAADARHRLPDPEVRLPFRRRDQRVAQPLRGQRHQVLRRRGQQAVGRSSRNTSSRTWTTRRSRSSRTSSARRPASTSSASCTRISARPRCRAAWTSRA